MVEHYQVIYTGQLQLGIEINDAIAEFCRHFKVSEEKAKKLLSSAREVVLKKSLEKQKAEKYQRVLESVGMVVRLEPMQPDGLSLVPLEEETDPDSPTVASLDNGEASARSPATCPKCGSDRLQNDSCLSCGIVIPKYLARQAAEAAEAAEAASDKPETAQDPYAAPRAELVGEAERGALSGPHSRPFGNGWQWISRGFWHFRQNPLAWMLTLVVWVVLSVILSMVPFIGSLAITLGSPVIIAGLMLGCAAQEQGDDFEISHLFAGFSSGVGQLVLVGLLYLVGVVAITFVVAMIGGGVMVGMLGGMDGMQNPDPDALQSAMGVGSVVLVMLVALGLSIPLMMAYWFAPALIAIEGLSALAAMKQSFSGCLKNILPFLLYGVIGLLLFFVGAIPVGLGLLVVMPMMTASMYTAYRDIYYQ